MTATPAERLTAAADLLDERVSSATIGPWSVSDPILEVGGERGFDVDGPHGGYVSRLSDAHDAHYIATMHPEVGKALAGLLRASVDAEWSVCERALTLADLILGGAS